MRQCLIDDKYVSSPSSVVNDHERRRNDSSRRLERGTAEEGGGGELRRTGPFGDIEGGFGVRGGFGGIEVMLAKGLLDAVTCVLLLDAAGAFPVKEKSLSADGAMNIRGTVRGFAKDLHMNSFIFCGS